MAINNIKIGNFSNQISEGIKNIYSNPAYTGTNVNFLQLANATGFASGLPNASSGNDTPTEINQDGFKGLIYNQNSVDYQDGKRFMQDRGENNFAPGNTWIIAGTQLIGGVNSYQILSWSDDNKICKNGTAIINSLNAGTTNQATATFAIGDCVTGSKPFSIFKSTSLPALTGAYGGYCGYTFATYNQRASGGTHIVRGFTLDPEPAQKSAAIYTAEQNVGTYPLVLNGNPFVVNTLNWSGTGFSTNNKSANMTVGNCYWMTSEVLMCAWRGRIEASTNALKDAHAMFPLTNEIKYGWFSTTGHILSAAGAQQRIDGGTSTYTLNNRASNGVTSEWTTTNMGGTNVNSQDQWIYVDSSPSRTGGSYFSGSPSVVYIAPSPNSEFEGPIFTCESQGDGNGTQKTTFVTEKCMSKYTCNHGGGDWMAFLSTFQDSNNAATIVRKSDSRNHVSNTILGNTTNGYTLSGGPGPCTTARLTSLTAGDIFKIITPNTFDPAVFAAWCDTNTAVDDEMTLVMGDDMKFNNPQSMSWVNGSATGGGNGSASAACNAQTSFFTLYTYESNTNPVSGQLILTDSNGDFSFCSSAGVSTAGLWYKFQDPVARLNFAVSFITGKGTGIIDEVVGCSDKRMKKNIEKIGVSPSGINIYRFEFKDTIYGKGEFTGVIAQEVPQATQESEGILFVNYELLDVDYQAWNGSNCTCKQDYCYNCTH